MRLILNQIEAYINDYTLFTHNILEYYHVKVYALSHHPNYIFIISDYHPKDNITYSDDYPKKISIQEFESNYHIEENPPKYKVVRDVNPLDIKSKYGTHFDSYILDNIKTSRYGRGVYDLTDFYLLDSWDVVLILLELELAGHIFKSKKTPGFQVNWDCHYIMKHHTHPMLG